MNRQTKMQPRASDSQLAIRLWPALAYMAFIVYGSLLPFEMKPIAFEVAWASFQHLPTLLLDVGGRADFVANILLYIPAGFLACAWLVGQSRRPVVVAIGTIAGLALLVALALGVEFMQQYFPARTVSLNDIVAEIVGAVIGIGVWLLGGVRFVVAIATVARGGREARAALLAIYVMSYLLLSLLPYDFLLSFEEWQQKLASDKLGGMFAPACGELCFLKLVPEVLAAAPLGIFLAFMQTRRRLSLSAAAITGLLLGLIIEGLQIVVESGITQGASIASRGVGVMLGAWLAQLSGNVDWQRWRRLARRIVLLSTVPYLAAVAGLNNWFASPWLSFETALARLPDIHFMPFYYHYYTAEAVAAVSLLYQSGLYFPIGVAVWLWRWGGTRDAVRQGPGLPAFLAACLAMLIETGKLFVLSQHPDPTDVPIAAAAAFTAYWMLNRLVYPKVSAGHQAVASSSAPHSPEMRATGAASLMHTIWGRGLGAAAMVMAVVAAVTSPLGAAWVLPPILLYMALLWRWPGWWLVAVLASLPMLDLTSWSGRLFWTEYDTLLLATIGVGYFKLHLDLRARPKLRRNAWGLLVLFSVSGLISLGIGLLPLAPLDANAFVSYASPYNALRVAKGFFFAMLLIPLLAREWMEPEHATRRLAWGMLLGIATVALYVVWERVTFAGLLNFETNYRVTGPFPGMHVGGAYIETYLAAGMSFIALWAWQQRRLHATLLAGGLYALGAYCIMVTFSRAGQVAFAVTTLIVLFGFTRLALGEKARRFRGVGVILLMSSLALTFAWPVFSGKYSQSRWLAANQDMSTRATYWADALHILRMRNAEIFGAGLGAYPAAYFWNSSAPSRPATYAFIAEQGNTFLRLGTGDALYFEQRVAVVPGQSYTLTMNLRSDGERGQLQVPICEKALLYSFKCVWTTVQTRSPMGQWESYRAEISTQNLGPPGSRAQRPILFSLSNGSPAGTIIDVDNLSLQSSDGRSLLRNGDFADGMHQWFFSVDNYWPWHIENLYLYFLFEQGYFGLICFLFVLAYAATRWMRRAWKGDPLSAALCASLTAFLIVGVFNSWIDEPRLGFLFYFLLMVGLIADGRPAVIGARPAIRAGV